MSRASADRCSAPRSRSRCRSSTIDHDSADMIKTRISSLLHVPPDSQVLLCERAILSKSKRIADVVISVRPSPTSLTAVVCSHSLLHHSLSSRYWCSGGTSDGLHRPRRLPYPTLARHLLPYPVRHSLIDRHRNTSSSFTHMLTTLFLLSLLPGGGTMMVVARVLGSPSNPRPNHSIQ